MADAKISELTDGSTIADADEVPVVQGGVTKRFTVAEFAAAPYFTNTYATLTATVLKSLFDANTILMATSDNTPVALTVGASTIVGRKSSGNIVALTGAETAAIQAGETYKQAQEFNAQTGTTYTLAESDIGKMVTLSNAGAITFTFPQDSDATIPVGTGGEWLQLGAGQVTAAQGTGATLRASGPTLKSRAQYSRGGWQKISANTFSFFGDVAAA